MCDTMVALSNSTKNGTVIFAKNSDRQPNEPHLMIHIPRQQYPAGAKVKCTYITIDQVEQTYEVLLLKPSWMWGAEMGSNEFGLNIGNEAVFTKVKQGPPSLLGMDLLRLALERCRTSKEALDLIIELLAKHGQGGNCGYQKKFVYHNSFLIADRASAWVLETAGPYWAAQRVQDVRAISNRLSIGKEYDLAHPELEDYATKQGWRRSAEDFHFANCYSNRLYTTASGARQRQRTSITSLAQTKGRITVETMTGILRTHESKRNEDPFTAPSLKSVCMHGGGPIGDHTTGSYVACLSETQDTYWLTGSSTPCISVFKPYRLGDPVVYSADQEEQALRFWLQRERLHRLVLENRIPRLEDYLRAAQGLEGKGINLGQTKQLNAESVAEIWREEQALVKNTLATAQSSGRIRGSLFFRHYWKKQSKQLGF